MWAGGHVGEGSCGRGSLTFSDRLRSEISIFFCFFLIFYFFFRAPKVIAQRLFAPPEPNLGPYLEVP